MPELYETTRHIVQQLASLDIRNWTTLSITNEMAADVLALYFVNDFPVLPLFDRELFLSSLLQYEPYHCSSLLVNALLAWSCVSASSPFSSTHSIIGRCIIANSKRMYSILQLTASGLHRRPKSWNSGTRILPRGRNSLEAVAAP